MGIFDGFIDKIREGIKSDIEELVKSDGDSLVEKPQPKQEDAESTVASKAIVFDPYFAYNQQSFIQSMKQSRISNRTLKDVSLRDWLVSAIIQVRCDTMLRFSRPEHRKFEMGFAFVKRNHDEEYTAEDKEIIANLEDFIYNCGRKAGVAQGHEMLLGEFFKLIVRDALTFGSIAIEKVLTRAGALHHFRPVPGEAVYRINSKISRDIIEREVEAAVRQNQLSNKRMDNSPEADTQPAPRDISYYKYVQMSYDNRVLAPFGDEDMIFKIANPQNFSDSCGYGYGLLEMALIQITAHMNTENYNSNVFTHGFAAKGLLHLKGTVTQSQLSAFRTQFYNSISGTQHAWRTPIVSGLDDIQWVPLAAKSNEMEYINYNHHVMRTICTHFQIDPVELGLDFLTSPGNRATQAQSNEFRVNYSRERGLFPILMMIEDLINLDIIPALDKSLADKYMFKFVGYTDETPQTNIALKQSEMSVHASMNDLLRDAKKEKIDHPIGDMPLNQAFYGMCNQLLTKGEMRALFLGDKDAMSRPELAYIAGDPSFMAFSQLLMTSKRMQKQDKQQEEQMKQQQDAQAQQAQAQQAQQSHDQEMDHKSHSLDQEKHEAEMREVQARHAALASGNHPSLKDTAKEFGAASKPIETQGGPIANPLNTLGKDA